MSDILVSNENKPSENKVTFEQRKRDLELQMITAEYLVTHCRYWDGTSDYYDRLMIMAEEYINITENPTITEYETYVVRHSKQI